MDFQSALGLAKKGYEAYTEAQSNSHKTGGEEYNSPDNRPPQQQQHHSRPQYDNDDSGDHDNMISKALSHLKQNANNEPTDEHHLKKQHDEAAGYHEQVYNSQSKEGLDVQQIGSAAAMQIFKQFSSGGGGMDQSQLITLAIQEASKLLSGSSAANRQEGMNSAATTALKLFAGSSLIGGGNSGGLGTMMSVASKLF
ncbi:beta-flanking protein [Phlebopus sp. FC_14]|nr:beta-flanking protein [Phlebopus sp. FC_14]